ncbi:putative defensin-like protein 234 [Brassica napus]|uniref:(rape) hypothetical protein n=1 Tax=Brassica napus TaxID=3708 RepID=A0A816MYR9_BRANA|nr:putative defensin-like protein 234 [Brassica napus]CAF2026477.1 unnamed protein product [Brassica napus]
MRSASIFLVSCILIFFIMNNVKDVEAGLTPMDNQCGRKDIFVGGCGPDGNKTCINDFVKKGGEGNRPSSCECDDFGEEHLCRCNFSC